MARKRVVLDVYEKKFCERLAEYFQASYRAQTALAERTGIKQTVLSAIAGTRQVPKLGHAVRIARGLQCAVEDMVADVDPKLEPLPSMTPDEQAILRMASALGYDEAYRRLLKVVEPSAARVGAEPIVMELIDARPLPDEPDVAPSRRLEAQADQPASHRQRKKPKTG